MLKKIKKSDLIICSTLCILYTFMTFYHFFIIKKIDSIDLVFRLLTALSLFTILKFNEKTNDLYTVIMKPPIFFMKYFIYIGLTFGFLFELSSSFKKNLCSKKTKITSSLFIYFSSKDNCSANLQTQKLF